MGQRKAKSVKIGVRRPTTKARPALLMLERWIEPATRHMPATFTTHEYIEKLRELCPADYAHDLAIRTLEQGFPQSLAVLHRAIANELRKSDRVRVIGSKESRDIRGNKHSTLVWRRRDVRRRPRPRGEPPMPGAQLRAARTALGWTMTELARRAGVSLAAVSLWEREKRSMRSAAYEAIQKALEAAHAQRDLVGRGSEGSPVAKPSRERV